MHPISAISPIDGRYHAKTFVLIPYFSEQALFRYRVLVEVEYFISLCEIPLPQLSGFPAGKFPLLRSWYEEFDEQDALAIKEIEKTTNHDIKAVEYFLKGRFDANGLGTYREFIHFALTSQDINNTAVPLSIKGALANVLLPAIRSLTGTLEGLSHDWSNIPMLAHTHGQPASPTTLGKEILVFAARLKEQLELLQQVPIAAKFGGATGNFNAHKVAYPDVDWTAFAKDFVENTLALHYSYPTTQIEHYDHLAALFDNLKRLNTIMIDLNRDIWTYISMGYFTQSVNPGETGSSACHTKSTR